MVAINKFECCSKIEGMLSDKNTYEVIKGDPTKNWPETYASYYLGGKTEIDMGIYRRLMVSDGYIPRVYGLPKIHKPGNPLRIIVSSVNSPLYNLADFLHLIIKNSTPKACSHVQNSYHLVNKLNGTVLDPSYNLHLWMQFHFLTTCLLTWLLTAFLRDGTWWRTN